MTNSRLLTSLLFILLLSACSSNNDVVSNSFLQKRKYNKGWYLAKRSKLETKLETRPSENPVPGIATSSDQTDEMQTTMLVEHKEHTTLVEQPPLKQSSLPDPCDQIVFKNGHELSAKVLEITDSQVKYRLCGDDAGEIYTRNREELFMIKHANGSKTMLKTDDEPSATSTHSYVGPKKVEPLSLAGFITSVASLFTQRLLQGLILWLGVTTGLILSLIGYFTISKNSDKYWGKGFSIAGMSIGFAYYLILLFVLSLFLILFL